MFFRGDKVVQRGSTDEMEVIGLNCKVYDIVKMEDVPAVEVTQDGDIRKVALDGLILVKSAIRNPWEIDRELQKKWTQTET